MLARRKPRMGKYEYEFTRNRIHPLKFTLWVSIVSLFMLFAALTSAYVVRQSSGNWLEFDLPTVFQINTGVILLSSLTLHLAYVFFKRGKEWPYKISLFITLVLGIAFIVLQYEGWMALEKMGIVLAGGNASGQFVIVISGIHAAHVIGGVAALVLANLHAFILPFKRLPFRKLRLELTLTYWHFVDALWIYLLLIFSLQSN